MNNIEKLKEIIMKDQTAVISNPFYLDPEKVTEQQDRSMLGQRTRFLKFHRFIFNLEDVQLNKLWSGYKIKKAEAEKNFPDDIFCDLLLLSDAIQYQLVLRKENQFDIRVASEIVKSFYKNVGLADSYEEITSDHLISLAQDLLK